MYIVLLFVLCILRAADVTKDGESVNIQDAISAATVSCKFASVCWFVNAFYSYVHGTFSNHEIQAVAYFKLQKYNCIGSKSGQK